MASYDIAWAAGLFEGEGTVTRTKGIPRLALKMTDFEPVRRFAAVVEAGRIYGPYDYDYADGHERKPFLMWVAMGSEAIEVAQILEPWLCERRQKQIARLLPVIA